MAELAEVWAEALPEIRKGVTGVGVWAALNGCKPLVIENGTLVLGLPSEETELSGHLRMANTRRLIEQEVGKRVSQSVTLRVIDGTSQEDWERAKRRDEEAKRLETVRNERARAEIMARTNWEAVYESLSRKFASTQNKSLPQNRARFYKEGLEILVEARRSQASNDDLSERNFARCVERLAQYAEVPSTLVATAILKETGEL